MSFNPRARLQKLAAAVIEYADADLVEYEDLLKLRELAQGDLIALRQDKSTLDDVPVIELVIRQWAVQVVAELRAMGNEGMDSLDLQRENPDLDPELLEGVRRGYVTGFNTAFDGLLVAVGAKEAE